jgi:VIT1/CCC1 family predicted Fe2+/Mn2+ transporter
MAELDNLAYYTGECSKDIDNDVVVLETPSENPVKQEIRKTNGHDIVNCDNGEYVKISDNYMMTKQSYDESWMNKWKQKWSEYTEGYNTGVIFLIVLGVLFLVLPHMFISDSKVAWTVSVVLFLVCIIVGSLILADVIKLNV